MFTPPLSPCKNNHQSLLVAQYAVSRLFYVIDRILRDEEEVPRDMGFMLDDIRSLPNSILAVGTLQVPPEYNLTGRLVTPAWLFGTPTFGGLLQQGDVYVVEEIQQSQRYPGQFDAILRRVDPNERYERSLKNPYSTSGLCY